MSTQASERDRELGAETHGGSSQTLPVSLGRERGQGERLFPGHTRLCPSRAGRSLGGCCTSLPLPPQGCLTERSWSQIPMQLGPGPSRHTGAPHHDTSDVRTHALLPCAQVSGDTGRGHAANRVHVPAHTHTGAHRRREAQTSDSDTCNHEKTHTSHPGRGRPEHTLGRARLGLGAGRGATRQQGWRQRGRRAGVRS